MVWQNFQGLRVGRQAPKVTKRRYSVTADVLAYQQCSRQYHAFSIRKYEPALAVQLFYGTVIHQVLDRTHAHFRGLIDPNTRGTLPTDQDIDVYFREVENSLRARRIRALPAVRDQALEILKRFNRLEGPVLYPRVLDTECRLQADQGSYILHGNVDVLASVDGQPNEIEIWDYKGAAKPSMNDPEYQRYVFQMQVYAELYRRRTGQSPLKAKLYFLNELSGPLQPQTRPANAILEVDLSTTAVQAAIADFATTVLEIEQSRNNNTWRDPIVPPPVATCNACDLRWSCPAAQRFGRQYPPIYP